MNNNLLKLAQIISEHSISVKSGERVLIRFKDINTIPLVESLIARISQMGGIPFVKFDSPEINNMLKSNYTETAAKDLLEHFKFDILNHDSFITIGYNKTINKPDKKLFQLREFFPNQVTAINEIYNNKKWVIVSYPSLEDAINHNMEYEEYFASVLDLLCTDYIKMGKLAHPLKELMDKTDKVRILSQDTDLSFSIKNINSTILNGIINIPDGELFTAPVLNSVNGHITFNVDSKYMGTIFKNIRLEFKNGKVVSIQADNNVDKLKSILSLDNGASCIGEFAFGINKKITSPMTDTLFDEKIAGSVHIALGNSYPSSDNGNKSCIHWDMVKIMTKEYGGGKVYFDDILIQKDGLFQLSSLKELNDEHNFSYQQ